jgi:hypothetical protein
MATDLQGTDNKPRRQGFRKGVSGNPRGAALNADRFRAAVADLSAQVVEVNGGKPVTPSQAVLIGQIARLQLARGGDIVRQSRAVADLLRQLGLDVKPQPPPEPTLQDYLRQRAAEAGR